MFDVIFNHYLTIAPAFIYAGAALLLIFGLFHLKTLGVAKLSLLLIAYLTMVVVGMVEPIKHINGMGIVIWGVATVSLVGLSQWYKYKITWLLCIPWCCLSLVVIFNLGNHGRGLEILGRWIA